MQTAAQFHASPQFALLMIGLPFTGKTNLAFEFPDPYFLDYDDKLANAVRRHPNKRFWFDVPTRKPDGSPVPVADVWDNSVALLKEAVAAPQIRTIVIDSITNLNTALMAHIIARGGAGNTKPLIIGGERVMDKSMWMPYRDILTRMIMGLRSTGKLIIVIAHTVADKDELTGVWSYRPSFAGQLQHVGAGLFTDVWETFTTQTTDTAGQPVIEYKVRSVPRPNMPLGNSLELPPEFVFNWEGFEKRLLARVPAPQPEVQTPPVST